MIMRYFLLILTLASSQLTAQDRLHPLFKLENVFPEQEVELKVSAMTFHGNDLYVTAMTPDRQDKAPDKDGKIFRVTGLIGNSDRSKIRAEVVMKGLFEPAAIAIFEGKIYIGEKDKISRLDDLNNDGKYTKNEQVVLISGVSQPNFHTYTVGFGLIKRDGKTFLGGNLTTSVKIGGARAHNVTVNPKTKRGSTFLLGPITGTEKPSDVDIRYLAGGYRTPNGFNIGPSGEIVVTDNQGVFNPTNEFIRITEGAFYGHYLLKRDDSNTAAFQPDAVDSKIGGSRYQTPPTVHMPQGIVSRSPTQPIALEGLSGPMAVYNGQWLVGDLTLGRINRVFVEQVEGVWQGAAFLHSGGHDPEGKTGLTAGPNRIVRGPDGQYYIGHIGHGGLWRFLPKKGEQPKPLWGLQRLSFVSPKDIPTNFNEMVAVRDIPGGLEVEFFHPVSMQQLSELKLSAEQWTYVPTNGYGGRPFGNEKLNATVASVDGKRLRLKIDGIRDNTPPYITHKKYSNENVGWVIQLTLGGIGLYKDRAWYTMVHHQGGGTKLAIAKDKASVENDPVAYAKAQFKAVCAACHSLDGSRLAGPSFKGLAGKEQKIIRDGKEMEIKVDRDYLQRAIRTPLADIPVGYPPAMPNLGLSPAEEKAMVDWILSGAKN